MGLPDLFKRKNNGVSVVDAPPEETALRNIAVRDVKAYLVQEFERANKLNEELERMKEKELNEYRPLQAQLDASLVLIDEYKRRLEQTEQKCEKLEKELFAAKDEADTEREKQNDLVIKLEQIGKEAKAIRGNIIRTLAPLLSAKLSRQILEVKGNLSKSKAREIVTESCSETELEILLRGEQHND